MQFSVLHLLKRKGTPGVQQCNRRITQTHLLKLNDGVPRMGLELSFLGDLLCMAAWFQKSGGATMYTDFYTREEPN